MRRRSPWLFGIVFTVLVMVYTGPIQADCVRGKQLYQQAEAESDLSAKAALLEESLSKCKEFNAYYLLAQTQLKLARLGEASQSIESAYALAANNKAKAAALALMSQILEAQDMPFDAVACLRRSHELYPFPRVARKLERMETKLASSTVDSQVIVRSLRSATYKTIAVERADARPRINLRIQFDYDSARLNPQGRAQAEELARALADRSLANDDFLLIGHTDSRGTDAYNQGLSERRAEAVADYLTLHYEKLRGRLRTEGHGEREPLYPGVTEQQHALNRRVEVRVK